MPYYCLKIHVTKATAQSLTKQRNKLKLSLEDAKRISKFESQIYGQLAEIVIEKQ
jgi:hypothetical protein